MQPGNEVFFQSWNSWLNLPFVFHSGSWSSFETKIVEEEEEEEQRTKRRKEFTLLQSKRRHDFNVHSKF